MTRRRNPRNPQTETPAFRRWFGNSKVVDAAGEPLVVYHAGFDVLRSPEGAFRLSYSGRAGMGIYFTPSLSGAERYLGRARATHHEHVKIAKYDGLPIPPPPAITAVYLSVQNPAIVDRSEAGGREPSEMLASMVVPKRRYRNLDYELEDLLRYTRKAGYDGVFVTNGEEVEEILVFDPRQIKSATANVGAFDPADPDLRRNPTPPVPRWFARGTPVASDFDALEAASADAPYILEPEDLAMEWRISRVPLSAVVDSGRVPDATRLAERLSTIRAASLLARPIYQLRPDGKVEILDGWHRLQVAKERGERSVSALVGAHRRNPVAYPRVVVALDQHLPQATARVEAGFYFEEGGCIGMALALHDTLQRHGVAAPLALFPDFKHAGVLVGRRFLDASGLGLQETDATPVTRRRLLEVAREWGNTAEDVFSDQVWAQQAIDIALEEEPVVNPRRNGRGGTSADRTDPDLWEDVKCEVTAGGKGGKPGQWSARKAQLAVALYRQRGGGYWGPKDPRNALAKWTREKWRTKSGRPSLETGERYLPTKALAALTDAEYAATTRAKRAGMRKGQQFVPQPEAVALKVRAYRRNPRNPYTETPASSATKGAAFRRWFGKSVTTDRNGDPVVFYHGSDEPDIEAFDVQRTSYGYFFTPDVDTAAYYGDNIYEVYLKIENLADFDEPVVFDRIAREAVAYTEERDREAVQKFAARLYREGYGKHPAVTAFFDAQRGFEYVLNEGWDIEEMLSDNDVDDRDIDALVARINQPNVTEAYNDAAPVESKELRQAEEAYGGQDFYMNYQNDFLHAAENLGYDGVVMTDPSPTGEAISYIVFSPTQIKSATKNAGTFDPDDANIYRNPRRRNRR